MRRQSCTAACTLLLQTKKTWHRHPCSNLRVFSPVLLQRQSIRKREKGLSYMYCLVRYITMKKGECSEALPLFCSLSPRVMQGERNALSEQQTNSFAVRTQKTVSAWHPRYINSDIPFGIALRFVEQISIQIP